MLRFLPLVVPLVFVLALPSCSSCASTGSPLIEFRATQLSEPERANLLLIEDRLTLIRYNLTELERLEDTLRELHRGADLLPPGGLCEASAEERFVQILRRINMMLVEERQRVGDELRMVERRLEAPLRGSP